MIELDVVGSREEPKVGHIPAKGGPHVDQVAKVAGVSEDRARVQHLSAHQRLVGLLRDHVDDRDRNLLGDLLLDDHGQDSGDGSLGHRGLHLHHRLTHEHDAVGQGEQDLSEGLHLLRCVVEHEVLLLQREHDAVDRLERVQAGHGVLEDVHDPLEVLGGVVGVLVRLGVVLLPNVHEQTHETPALTAGRACVAPRRDHDPDLTDKVFLCVVGEGTGQHYLDIYLEVERAPRDKA